MTDQYTSTNINSPRNPYREIAADGDINLDDFFVSVDSSAAPVTLTLPDARSIPNWSAYIKALNGAVNPVTIQAQPGQTIDGLASVQLTADGESISVFSTGTAWQTGPGGGATAGGVDTTQPISDVALYGVPAGTSLSLLEGQRGEALDMSVAGLPIVVELPEITAGFEGVGIRCSFVIPTGNAGQDLTVNPFAGDGVVDPATGQFESTITYPAGSLSGYTVLTWEGVVDVSLPVDPASSIDTFSPTTEVGFPPNGAVVSCTATGTGGTLPTIPNMVVTLTPFLGAGQATLVSPGDITITSAVQGGGPGTAWTVTFDILIGELTVSPAEFDCQIDDATGPTVPFAGMTWAFTAFPNGPGQNPTQIPVPSAPGGVLSVWMFDTSNPLAGAARWDETLVAGPNTNGNDTYVTLEDEVVFSTATAPLADPTVAPTGPGIDNFHPKSARLGTVAPGAGFANIGSAIHAFSTGFGARNNNKIWMRWVGEYKTTSVNGQPDFAVLEEIWNFSGGSGWSRVETLVASAESGRFRFNGDNGTGEIFIQGESDDAFTTIFRGVVEWSWELGSIPN